MNKSNNFNNDRLKELEKKCWNTQVNQLDTQEFTESIIRDIASLFDRGSYVQHEEGIIRESILDYYGIKDE